MQREQKIHLLDQAMIECNWGTPKSKIIDRPEWAQILTADAVHSSANCVFRSRLASSEVQAKVTQTFEQYEAMKVPYRWLVTPLTEPADLSKVLISKGMTLLYEATAMMSSVEDQIQPMPEGVSVVKVDLNNVEVYVETFVRSWELPSHQVADFKKDVIYGLETSADRFLPFVAYYKNEPVGTSALLNIPSGGYLAAGTVDPKYRGRGIYRAMVSHRAEVAKQLNHDCLLMHAKKLTSAPICKKLGFEAVFDYQVFSKEK